MRPIILFTLLVLLPAVSQSADYVYITNQIKAGLHEDKSLDSPILKVLPTGTRLEIVKREDKLSFVRDNNGVTGWINNGYLMANAANDAEIDKLQRRAVDLEKRISDFKDRNIALENQLKAKGKPSTQTQPGALAELEQKFKAEKLKVGELQIEITELRNRLGQDSDADTLYSQIKSLEEDNKKLEIQLLNTIEKYQADAGEIQAITSISSKGFQPGARNMMIYLLITLFIGLAAGAYLLDLWNRKRHGGFRI